MGKYVTIDISEFEEFFSKLGSAGKDFKNDLALFLEATGEQFLTILQDEIIRKGHVDTRLLLQSFTKGDDENIFVLHKENLTLEIGTNLEYAYYVNNGHNTVTANSPGAFYIGKSKKVARWVPGNWNGKDFEYDPSSNDGMILTQKFVPGTKFWESGIKILEEMLPEYMEAFMEDWIETKLGEFL